jgi:DNA polymerase III alpha subunit (gram-positive type)
LLLIVERLKQKEQQIQKLLKDIKELKLEKLQQRRSKDTTSPSSQDISPTLNEVDMYLLLKLETTGLPDKQGRYPDICQIATLEMNSEEEWNCYIIPEKEIKPSAAELNKFEVHISEKGERTLTQNGQKVPAKDYAVGLQDFYDYLRKKSIDHRKVHPNGNVILVAHNCMNFDAPILLNAFVKMNITSAQDLLNMGVFFVDTYKILQIAKPSFLEGHSLSLPHLCEEFFHEKFPDDNAQEKLLVLRKVLNDSDFGFTTLSKLSFYKFSPQPLLDF